MYVCMYDEWVKRENEQERELKEIGISILEKTMRTSLYVCVCVCNGQSSIPK